MEFSQRPQSRIPRLDTYTYFSSQEISLATLPAIPTHQLLTRFKERHGTSPSETPILPSSPSSCQVMQFMDSYKQNTNRPDGCTVTCRGRIPVLATATGCVTRGAYLVCYLPKVWAPLKATISSSHRGKRPCAIVSWKSCLRWDIRFLRDHTAKKYVSH